MRAEDIKGKKALVIGSGISGVGSVRLLHSVGAVPVLLDEDQSKSPEEIRGRLRAQDRDASEIIVGQLPDERYGDFDLVIPSPGVPLDTPLMKGLRGRGARVWSEVELACSVMRGRLVAITGTNGKTTTTTLVGEICKAHFGSERVHVVGNIGASFAEEAMEIGEGDLAVAELSSFQLEAVENLHAEVAAVLNITPDHLNRHHTMEEYARCKGNITINQTGADTCVLGHNDPYTIDIAQRTDAKVVWFSGYESLSEGYSLEGEDIVFAENGQRQRIMSVREMNLVGVCNAENVMAAIAMTRALGVPMEEILSVVRSFRAVSHRIEFIAEKRGVVYYNDSKATNPDAAIQGIRAMERPTVLLGGGYDKGGDFDTWIDSFGGKVKKLVLIGATADRIEECARSKGFDEIVRCGDFESALKSATTLAQPGDAVLLSPACASWDMFKSYEERGDIFREYVQGIED